MRAVAYITTTDCRDYVMCICNVLVSKSARVISINQPQHRNVVRVPGDSSGDREWTIWFEHECAIERAWCESVLYQAQEKWVEIKDASKSDARSTTG